MFFFFQFAEDVNKGQFLFFFQFASLVRGHMAAGERAERAS